MSNLPVSESVLSMMHSFLDNEKIIGREAPAGDLLFLEDQSWLKDSAVIDGISNCEGKWDVSLIFAYHKNPLQLIVRAISRCTTEQQAKATAFYIGEEVAKNRRCTSNILITDLNLCDN